MQIWWRKATTLTAWAWTMSIPKNSTNHVINLYSNRLSLSTKNDVFTHQYNGNYYQNCSRKKWGENPTLEAINFLFCPFRHWFIPMLPQMIRINTQKNFGSSFEQFKNGINFQADQFWCGFHTVERENLIQNGMMIYKKEIHSNLERISI